MSHRVLEGLERNRAWRVFRHSKALGDIFNYFGLSAWIASFVATALGALVAWLASLALWAKIVLGLLSVLVVTLIAAAVAVGLQRFNQITGQNKRRRRNT